MTRDEAQSWIQDLQWLGQESRYFFSLNRYLFSGDQAASLGFPLDWLFNRT